MTADQHAVAMAFKPPPGVTESPYPDDFMTEPLDVEEFRYRSGYWTDPPNALTLPLTFHTVFQTGYTTLTSDDVPLACWIAIDDEDTPWSVYLDAEGDFIDGDGYVFWSPSNDITDSGEDTMTGCRLPYQPGELDDRRRDR